MKLDLPTPYIPGPREEEVLYVIHQRQTAKRFLAFSLLLLLLLSLFL